MIGSIIGDVIGSPYEFGKIKNYNFDLFVKKSTFTDDTVMTCATAFAILNNKSYSEVYREFGKMFPNRGYGGMFQRWINNSAMKAYNSYGNGSAMRISPIGWVFNTIEGTLAEAKKSAEVTHNHLEGIKGAQAVAAAIFLARNNAKKDQIRDYIEKTFNYNLQRDYQKIKDIYKFDVTCQGSVPEAIICFLESKDFEDCIRLSVALGGDCDTQACIAGGIAEAFYESKNIPEIMLSQTIQRLDNDLFDIMEEFTRIYFK